MVTLKFSINFVSLFVLTCSIVRSTKPGTLTASDMFADMYSQDSARCIIVPASLPDKFLSVCLDNTQKNVETCGILAAKLTANNFTSEELYKLSKFTFF